MRILDLVVAEPWFSLATNGIKTEEFRRDCDHWRKRFMTESGLETSKTRRVFRVNTRGIPTPDRIREFDAVCYRNGYGADRPKALFVCKGIKWQTEGIFREYGNDAVITLEMPGALFVISLGERIE